MFNIGFSIDKSDGVIGGLRKQRFIRQEYFNEDEDGQLQKCQLDTDRTWKNVRRGM